ncbi:hypothetical protein KA005_57335 [bacterium]|nr:hypothetical protein [bacterium]
MGQRGNLAVLLAFVTIAVLVQGCGVSNRITISIKRDLPNFQERAEKLPLSVGLFLDEKDKKYIITSTVMIVGYYDFMVGEALETSAIESLNKIFQEVSVIQEKGTVPSNIQRIITISFAPTSRFVLGTAGLSKHTAEVELICKVYDKDCNLLWKGSSIGNVHRATIGWWSAAGALGAARFQKEVGGVVNESLTAALERLNEQFLTSGKNAILGTHAGAK